MVSARQIIMPEFVRAPHFNDPDHWRQRAEEARVLPEQMKGEQAKQVMLGIAEDYDKFAIRAAIRIGDKE